MKLSERMVAAIGKGSFFDDVVLQEVAHLEVELANARETNCILLGLKDNAEAENNALRNFLRQAKAMMRERYQPHVIERQIDALLTDLKEVAQSTKEISAIPEDTQVSDVPASP